ncbi:DUF5663 domain-containing protein [Patescibacteria group bacterium]
MDQNPATNTISTPLLQPLEDFLDKLIEEKGFNLKALPNDFPENTKKELRPLLQKSINLSLYEALSDDKKKEFEKLIDTNNSDQSLQEFFTKNVPNQQLLLAETLLDFRNKYLDI